VLVRPFSSAGRDAVRDAHPHRREFSLGGEAVRQAGLVRSLAFDFTEHTAPDLRT
jgi:hypothetical protein